MTNPVDEVCPDVLNTILASAEAPKGCAQVACHSVAASVSGLDLESPNLVARLLAEPSSAACGAQPYLDANSVSNSLLMRKIGPEPYPCGGRMPTGAVLTENEILCVGQYLEAQLARSGDPDAGVNPPMDAGPSDLGVAPDQGLGAPDQGAGPPDLGTPSEVTIEAEAMSLTGPFQTSADPGASGGMFVTQSTGPLNTDPGATADVGRAIYDFTLPMSGPTRIFGRIRAADVDSDSFWVRIDNSAYVQWNDLNAVSGGAWTWDDVHDTPSDNEVPAEFMLEAGPHRLEIVYRETNAQLDRVVITQDPSFSPVN